MKHTKNIVFGDPEPLLLDYASAATEALLNNLSCAASVGDRLWTVADEGRTIECLKRTASGFRLERQYQIDDLFGELAPGAAPDELDLESMSFDGERLWLCGSHCRVRRKPDEETGELDWRFRRRTSRQFFGSIALNRKGGLSDAAPWALPSIGAQSLRRTLREDDYLRPFLRLPSKEGGLDIEGVLVTGKSALFGLRGPLVDSVAVVMQLALSEKLKRGASIEGRHFVDLQGLGVRGLARWKSEVLVIAGPVADAAGPFKLLTWRPSPSLTPQKPRLVFEWPAGTEKPEGICALTNSDGEEGLLVMFDSPARARISGTTYRAEWRRAIEGDE